MCSTGRHRDAHPACGRQLVGGEDRATAGHLSRKLRPHLERASDAAHHTTRFTGAHSNPRFAAFILVVLKFNQFNV